jgi:hypothetical protein
VPRALTIQRTIIPAHERKQYMARLRERKAYYARANCNLWIFEEAALPGAFIEFTEAPDRASLTAAHAAAPVSLVDPARIYVEVELS